jgi:hypothetical protein
MSVLARTSPSAPHPAGPAQAGPVLPRAATPDAPLSPLSFRERGLVLPATTPAFAFARVRDAAAGREIVLRNQAGTRGAMVIPLAKAAEFARPTLHDRALLADIARLPSLAPAQLATAARAAARAGLAGRSALAAAAAAGEAEGRAARAALALLLAELAARGGATGPLAEEAEAEPRRFSAARAESLSRGAATLGLPPAAMPATLARLATLAAQAARLAALTPRLRVFSAMAGDTAALLPERLAEDAAFIGAAAAATLGFAEAALRPVLERLADPAAAIAAHAADAAWPSQRLDRAGLVLDGWAGLLARWADAAHHGQAGEARAFRAIAAAIPPLPAELSATAEERAAVRATWRLSSPAVSGVNDQALLERLRVAVP